MHKGAWRREVAQLLEHCAESLRTNNDRQATAAFGTAVAYLQRAEDDGERCAIALLAQACSVGGDGNTQRFSFAPGELEELANGRRDR